MKTRNRKGLLRVFVPVVLLLLALFGLPQPARADWVFRGDTIPAGQVVDNDVIITGADVVVDGTVNGDLVAIGSTVTVNGPVQGSLVAVGRTVTLNGRVEGSVYVASRTLNLGSASRTLNNVHFAGLLLDSRAGSAIGRDLVAGSLRAQISGEIGRALNAIILLLQFDGKIGFGLDEEIEQPETNPAPSGAKDRYGPAVAQADSLLLFVGAGGHKIAGYAAPLREALSPIQLQAGDESGGGLLPDWLVSRTSEFVALLLIGGLVVWLLPRLLRRWSEGLRAKPFPAGGLGLLAVAIFVNSFAVALLLGIGILMVGLWLGSIDLWELAFLFWGMGYSSLILAFSTFTLAVFFGSKVIVAYLAGRLILERFYRPATEYRIVVLLLGLVLYILLRSVPYLGWVVEAAFIILGLGAMWLALRKQEEPSSEAIVQPAAVEVA